MEKEPTPSGGFPMRWAITALAVGEAGRTWVEFHDYAWQRQNYRDLAEAQRHLWIRLLDRARAGEVVFRGVKSGTSEISVIAADTMRGSEPDFLTDRLEASGTVYHAIGVFRGGDLAATMSTPASLLPSATSEMVAAKLPKPKKRTPRGTDYRQSDALLVTEMHRMIQAHEARNPTDAARAIAKKAEGVGMEASKVTRLIGRYTETFSPVQP